MEVTAIKRFDVCLVSLEPQKTRPCLVISPDNMNLSRLKTIIVAPLTSVIRHQFPSRVDLEFQGKNGQVALDQLRVIDRVRVVKVLGNITNQKVKNNVLQVLQVMFES